MYLQNIDRHLHVCGGTLQGTWWDGGICSSSRPLALDGIEAEIVLRSVGPLLADGHSVLSFHTCRLAVVQFGSGRIRFSMEQPYVLHLAEAQAMFCEGSLWTDAFSVAIRSPNPGPLWHTA